MGIPELNVASTGEAIVNFIREQVAAARSSGVVVGVSGGLDSATVVFLSVAALGPEKVTGLYLPERDSAEISRVHARAVAEKAGIKLVEIDLEPALKELGTYQGTVPQAVQNSVLNRMAVQGIASMRNTRPFQLTMEDGEVSEVIREAIAFFRIKHRLRMVTIYHFAEKHGLLVAGCLNRTEYLTGFFVRYGDRAADLAPILPLYKTHVRQLAKHLGVPQEVIAKAPTPDLIPGITDEMALGITYDLLDAVLAGLEQGVDRDVLAGELNVSPDKISYVDGLIKKSAPWRQEVPYPDLPGLQLP
ncbi:NAD+ synthase [Desulfofundulus australicus DSM 11792]|uniref:NH(3)-dependent NAD(+) synthetase n=1 Tax=Desulfofundulus australicus DSM 11792 TaxID=1121425 RepID=A0A1M5BFP8_9FIRM|nr:NAD(+) synthase [Desulfofundulus australicus]SHF41286.1 NAD+ synthase [Desulfofundulus australicus DSM 11792]